MARDLPQLRVALAMDRDELFQVAGNDRELLAHVTVMAADDVVRQLVDRRGGIGSVASSWRRREHRQLGADGLSGGWLVSVVAAQSVSVLGTQLAAGFGGREPLVLFFSLLLWLGGGML